jgi:hypothetical protein
MIGGSIFRKKVQEPFVFVIELAVPQFVVGKKDVPNLLKRWEIVLRVVIDKEDAVKPIGRRQDSIGE